MAIIPGSFDFRPHKSGTTSSDLFVQITKNKEKTPVNISGYIIEARFTGPSRQTLSTANAGIVITDAANGRFKIASQLVTWTKGLYNFEIFFQTSSGKRNVYVTGQRLIT